MERNEYEGMEEEGRKVYFKWKEMNMKGWRKRVEKYVLSEKKCRHEV